MFKSKGKFEVTSPASKGSTSRTSSQNEERERRKRTPTRSASNKDQVASILSPSPRLINFSTSPSLQHHFSTSPSRYPPPSATSTTSKQSWETVTVPLRNQRSMKIKYYKGPKPKLKPTESAINIYPDTEQSAGCLEDVEEYDEDDGVFLEDDVQYTSSPCKHSSPTQDRTETSPQLGKRNLILQSERIFKIFWALLCFSIGLMFAATLMAILIYYILK